MSKEEMRIKACPCGGKMELLNDQRHMKQRVSREKYELVCDECGLTVKHPSKSTHKLIAVWNDPKNTYLMEHGELAYIDKIEKQLTALRSFARKVIDSCWESYDMDAADVQEWALKAGLIEHDGEEVFIYSNILKETD